MGVFPMPRFEVERVTEDEADILVEGRVTLYFRNIEGRVLKVASSTYDRKPATVLRKDFLDARALAIMEMANFSEEQVPKDKKGSSDEDIARAVLKNAKQRNCSIEAALNVFLKSATWCNPNRRSAIMQEVGKIGGKASVNRAKQRRERKQREKENALQGGLDFT